MRVQNEGTGKSSWWMLNPDAKPGNLKLLIQLTFISWASTWDKKNKDEKHSGRDRKRAKVFGIFVIDPNEINLTC